MFLWGRYLLCQPSQTVSNILKKIPLRKLKSSRINVHLRWPRFVPYVDISMSSMTLWNTEESPKQRRCASLSLSSAEWTSGQEFDNWLLNTATETMGWIIMFPINSINLLSKLVKLVTRPLVWNAKDYLPIWKNAHSGFSWVPSFALIIGRTELLTSAMQILHSTLKQL